MCGWLKTCGALFKNKAKKVNLAAWAMVLFTFIIAASTMVYTVYAGRQWKTMSAQLVEMKSSGTDTHDLAVAAGKQADRTKDLVDRMKDQADQTKVIADQAVIQANAAKVTADAAQSAADTSIKAMELSQRPWLVVKATIESPLTFNKEGGRITLRYAIFNIGHSPATGVDIWPEFYVANGKKPDAVLERRRLCKEMEVRSAGQTIFPGESFEINATISMNRADIDDSAKYFGGLFVASVVDCVSYHADFSKQAYSVGSSYQFGQPVPNGGVRSFAPYIDMPLGSLILIPEHFYPLDAK